MENCIDKKIADSIDKISDSTKVTVTDKNCRETVFNDEFKTIVKYIKDWIKCDRNDLWSCLGNKADAFNGGVQLTAETYYRGIRHSPDNNKLKNIGPAPADKNGNYSNSRYSHPGRQALYLISKPDYIGKEINETGWREQKYVVTADKIADITPNNKGLDEYIKNAFTLSERDVPLTNYNIESLRNYDIKEALKAKYCNEYLFSQKLAKLFIKNGWQGILVPGVRGDGKEQYSNLVIFKPLINKWKDWAKNDAYDNTDRDSQPK